MIPPKVGEQGEPVFFHFGALWTSILETFVHVLFKVFQGLVLTLNSFMTLLASIVIAMLLEI